MVGSRDIHGNQGMKKPPCLIRWEIPGGL